MDVKKNQSFIEKNEKKNLKTLKKLNEANQQIALLKSDELANMLAFLIGAYLIYHNAVRLQIAMNLDGFSEGHYWKYIAGISAGCIVPGILILLDPFPSIPLSQVIAICIIVSSTINILQNIAENFKRS